MTTLDRRNFMLAAGAAAGTGLLTDDAAKADDGESELFDETIGVLYDATKCIGCRSCLRACSERNGLHPNEAQVNGTEFDMPKKLSPNNWTVLQVYREDKETAAAEDRPPEWSFIKKNCMHCNVPACVSVCPVAALRKTKSGPVIYEEGRCIGCRYCLLACPYHVPRYEWVRRMPRVRKCDWNRACVRACPVGALKEGLRKDLIAEAHQRIQHTPERYVEHVYGEQEAGGTSYLILAGVEHQKLGLPPLPPNVRSSTSETIVKSLPGWIVGMGLFLGAVYRLTHQRELPEHAATPTEKTEDDQ